MILLAVQLVGQAIAIASLHGFVIGCVGKL